MPTRESTRKSPEIPEDLYHRIDERLKQAHRKEISLQDFEYYIIDNVDRAFNQVIHGEVKVKCTIIETLAFYTPAPPQIKGVEPGPAIFISPEKIDRIIDEELAGIVEALRPWNKDYEIRSTKQDLFKYVLAHEITHSYADIAPVTAPQKKYKDTPISRIIEESLATYYGLMNIDNQIIENWILTKHPPEYRAAIAWKTFPNETPYKVLQKWIGLLPHIPILEHPYTLRTSYIELRRYLRYLTPPYLTPTRGRTKTTEPYILSVLLTIKTLATWLTLYSITNRNEDTFWKLLALQLLAQTPPKIN